MHYDEKVMSFTELSERLDRIEQLLVRPKREYLDTREAAEFLGLSTQQLELWRGQGGGPAFHRVGRAVRYSVADLRGFMDGCRNEPLR